MKDWILLQIHNYKPVCESCGVSQYCGTMVSSIRLCRSVMEQKIIKEAMKQLFNIIDIDAGKGRQAAHMTIQIGEQFFYIDKTNTFDAGWETMAFPCSKNGEVENWIEVYSDRSNKSLWECAKEFAEAYFKDQLDTYINS